MPTTKAKPSKHAVPRTKAAAEKFHKLTELDRTEAIEIVLSRQPSLRVECARLNLEQIESLVERGLRTDRVGPPFTYDAPGEVKLATTAEGLSVERDGRRGVLTWLDVAGAIADEFGVEDWDPEEPDDERPANDAVDPESIAGAMDFSDDEPEPGTGRPLKYLDRTVPLAAITLRPGNPRKVFDEAALAELADSLRAVGLLEPLIVREPTPDAFQLVAGERRWRAAQQAGLLEVPVRVGVGMTESEADEIRVVENLQRKDLSAIEEALGFQQMLEQHGYTQQRLAERIGVSQPHVANRLRLLKLPEAWQQRVISQEIPPTHARALLPWAEYPGIMAEIERRYFKKGKLADELPAVREFTDDVSWAVEVATKPMTGSDYVPRLGRSVEIFKPTDAEREQLGVITVDKRFGKKGEQETRATNVKLWEKLRAKQVKPLIAKRAAKATNERSAKRTKQTTAADAERFRRDLEHWRDNWLRFLIARRAVEGGHAIAARVLLFQMFGDEIVPADELATLLGFKGRYGYGDEEKIFPLLAATADPTAAIERATVETLWRGPFDKSGKPGSRWAWSTKILEGLAAALGIDLAECWLKELAGPLTEGFFNLHDATGLQALGTELEVYVKPKLSKTAAVKLLMGHRNTKLKLPSAIAPVAPLKSPRAKSSKPKRKAKS